MMDQQRPYTGPDWFGERKTNEQIVAEAIENLKTRLACIFVRARSADQDALNAARSGDLASRIENIKAARRLLSLSQQAIQEEIKS